MPEQPAVRLTRAPRSTRQNRVAIGRLTQHEEVPALAEAGAGGPDRVVQQRVARPPPGPVGPGRRRGPCDDGGSPPRAPWRHRRLCCVTTSVGLLPGLLADLSDESASLDALVADLPPEGWATPTPADGWTVAHQIAHLAWTDDQALLSVRSPGRVRRRAAQGRGPDRRRRQRRRPGRRARVSPPELLRRWRQGRADLVRELEELPEGERLPWYGPPMSAASLVTARLMETWAHGQDVADALGVSRPVDPPDPACGAPGRAHPGLLVRGPRPGPAAGGVPGRADRTGWRGLDLGPGGRRRSA